MGWLNNGVAALWHAGYRLGRVFDQRQTDPGGMSSGGWAVGVPAGFAKLWGLDPDGAPGWGMSAEKALQISAVWACVSVISKDIAASTWSVFEERANGDRDLRRDHRLFQLLNRTPNPEMTGFAFREAVMVSALLWGDGYAEIQRDASDRIVAVWPLHPDRVTPERDENDERIYTIWNAVGGPTYLPSRDVFHIHGPGVEGLVGFSVVRLAALLFGHTLAADTFGASFYRNGAHAGQVLETDQTFATQDEFDAYRTGVMASLQGAQRQMGLFIASGGAKLTNVSVEPEKAQFIETRQHLIEEIARWFDVPPHKIGHLLRATFNNIESLGIDYVSKIIPWCERLRQEAERKLVRQPNLVTRIEVDWLAEGTSKERAEADSTLVNAGIQSRNEVRRRRGLNSLGPEGDKLTVQQAMTTLERIGEEPATQPPPPDQQQDPNQDGEPPAPPDENARALRLIKPREST